MKNAKPTGWMSTFKRRIVRWLHDAYAQAAARLKPLNMVRDVSGLSASCRTIKIDTAGSMQVDNEFESTFHGKDLPTALSWNDLWLVELHNARVTGDQGHVFFSNGDFLSICPSLRHLPSRKVRRPILPLARHLTGVYFHLTGVDHENHGHFLFQHLPRLLAAREEIRDRHPDFKVLVAPGHRRWQARYLSFFGIPEERVVEASVGTISVETLLYVPMPYGNTYLCNPRFYRLMRDGFTSGLPPRLESDAGPVLFISRKDAPDRRLVNEDEILAICTEVFGKVEVVNLGKIPLSEQIRLCAGAKLVIGPQGQGMSVVLFMRGGAFFVMEYGKDFKPLGWCRAFCNVALFLGLRSLRLISGENFDEERCWSYPPVKFREEMLRLRDLLSPVLSQVPAA